MNITTLSGPDRSKLAILMSKIYAHFKNEGRNILFVTGNSTTRGILQTLWNKEIDLIIIEDYKNHISLSLISLVSYIVNFKKMQFIISTIDKP